MKKIILLLIFWIFWTKSNSQAINIKEPEFTGTIVLVRDSSSFEKLEKQKQASGSKADVGAAIFGVAKGKSMNIVNGASSPCRIKNGKTIILIVKVKENDKDPAEMINIFQLESDKGKDKRVLIVGTVNFNRSTTSDIKFIQFEASKYGTSSYLVEISNLPLGEYAVTIEGSREVFNMFGVD